MSIHILIAFALTQPPIGDGVKPADPASKPVPVNGVQTIPGKPGTSQSPAADNPSTRRVNYLGVRTIPISGSLASQLVDLIPKSVGLEVVYLHPDSPATAAGIKKHDLLVKFENTDIKSAAQLRQFITDSKPAATIKLTILRALKTQTIDVTLKTREIAARPGPGGFPGSMAKTGPAATGPRPTGRPRYF